MEIKKGNRTQMINKNSSYGGACGIKAITSAEENNVSFLLPHNFQQPPNSTSTFYNIVLVFLLSTLHTPEQQTFYP
ncbi:MULTISPECIES: hypothetical protein [Borreliella]|uniref:hypothetical protein n=1 Tax=Borreliella TaxID=64895 RepID=UPI000493D96F|nr:hypothetical protein [Borreliella garinii]